MSDVKWIKVAVDMFDHDKIDFLRSLPEGDSIIVTWIQMITIAGKSNNGGYLMVTDRIPYTEQLLSNKLRRQPVFLQFALNTLENLNMINVEDGPYHITNWEKHQNTDGMKKIKSKAAIRQKNYRERNKTGALPVTRDVTSDVTVTSRNDTELELEVELEKDTTTSAEIELQRVAKSYYDIHQHELKPRDWPEMTKAVKEYGADHIISVMEAKSLAASGDVTTFRYYLSAIKEKSEDTMNRRRKGNNTYYTSPSELEAQQAARMAEMRKQDIPMKYDPTF